MSSGIYAYWDNVRNYYVYVGKDSNIDKKNRHCTHISKSSYNIQQINRVLQNNPERYEYRVIMKGDYNDWQLNQMEKLCIKSFKTFKKDYPERSVFNFTRGGDGISGYTQTKETREKISKNNQKYWKDKSFSEEHKKKISESKIGTTCPKETRKKISESQKGNKNPRAKYTIWNINVIDYSKTNMFKDNGGNNPRKVFKLKYECKRISIGGFIDFITPEIIHDLICEAIEDYNE